MRPSPLNRRERAVLAIVEALHREYDVQPDGDQPGEARRFTQATIEHVAGGPCAGSVGVLAGLGLLERSYDEVVEMGERKTVAVFALTDDGRRAAALVRELQRHGRITVPRAISADVAADERSSNDGDE